MTNKILTSNQYSKLFGDINNLILDSKTKIEDFAKNQLVQTYWQIGKRIIETNLEKDAAYFSLIIKNLAQDLQIDTSTLTRSVQLFKTYPDSPPSQKNLTWSHYKYLLTINNIETRKELEKEADKKSWSVPKLGNEIKHLKNQNESGQNKLASKLKISKPKIIRPTKANYLYKARIVDVVDGDTLILNIDLGFQTFKEQRLRLAQIDAAEIKTKDGQKAFKYLRDLAATLDFVVVRTNKIDIYGRYVGDVFYPKISDGSNESLMQIEIFEKGIYLNEELVKMGLVKVI